MTREQLAARRRAVAAVQAYERQKLALQQTVRDAAETLRERVAQALQQWAALVERTDRQLDAWASALDYDPAADWLDPGSHGLEATPHISDDDEDFPQTLRDTDPRQLLIDLFADEPAPFPSEPADWSIEIALQILEQTEPWRPEED